MSLTLRRRWRNRALLLTALAAIVFAASWLVRPASAFLATLSQRLVTSVVRVQPVVVGEYFLLQAVACQLRAGFRCAPVILPGNRGSIARRPTIDPSIPVNRTDARKEIAAGLRGPAAWLRAAAATPGAAYYAGRWVTGYGWEAWASLAVSLALAAAVVFALLDFSSGSILLVPVAAAGIAWLLSLVLQRLAPSGPELPLIVYASAALLAIWRLRDLFEESRTFERLTRWRSKRRLARGE